ncbi:sensor histidine kinase [Carboxylicivirga linearis]|uniref:Histidine kinase n=1 Tax=Carboxylicivirga linearis TaxID=1628157 RepID=A0ABS5JQ76_9BACT|nr:histidine kinase [Carboxylicivirga linearis]MBS2097026.1 histidine kinase [Carboxylicivirga linearis]
MRNSLNISFKTIALHFIFWIGVWFFYYYFFSYNSEDKVYITWFSSCLLPLTMGVTYFMERYLIPRFLLTKKYQLFALYSFYTFVVSSYLIVLALYGCLIFLLQFNVSVMPPMSKNFLFILMLVYLIVGIISFIHILNNNFKTDARNKELENKILATQLQLREQELQYLKQQIHPHFLFNTLNTIYGLAIKKSEHTPEVILRLSNLLDYILYQVHQPKVSLKEEIAHIEEYIELERIRFKDHLKVNFTSSVNGENIKTAPMLLIPFIENAFKHGEMIDGFLSIDVNIEVKESRLSFSIANTIREINKNTKQGIGIENIKKRLDLHYQNNYELTILSQPQWYKVELIIKDLNQFTHE